MVQKSALLSKYLEQYKKRPTSRVFAPLAEAYRKLGMHDEALKVLKDGIRFNPAYPLGYIILSHCYYDLQNYDHAYDVIRPFVKTNLDNISLQKLFAQICEKIGHLDEALETYKYLLFVNPKDDEIASRVLELEKENYIGPVEENDNIETADSFDVDEENWVQVSFVEKEDEEDTPEAFDDAVDDDDWQMANVTEIESIETNNNALDKFKKDLESDVELEEPDLDDEYYHQDFDNEDEEIVEEVEPSEPIITHTLVDLYLKQNHFDKAIEFLESILKLHPNDEATRKKLLEVQKLASDDEPEEEHDRLLSLVEKSQEREKAQLDKVKIKLEAFLTKIKMEAELRGHQ